MRWFETKAAQIYRVLKPRGSFILNIKEGDEDGERQIYVYELVLAMRNWGWRWVDDFPWVKENPYPGKWPNRLKDGWEHCYHLTKQRNFAFYPKAVRERAAEQTLRRGKTLSERDRRTVVSRTSGLPTNRPKSSGKLAYPSNVRCFPCVHRNTGHKEPFPEELPEFFIKLFTRRGGLVLDPFMGSGTTAVVAKRLGRNWLGCEKRFKYWQLIWDRLGGW